MSSRSRSPLSLQKCSLCHQNSLGGRRKIYSEASKIVRNELESIFSSLFPKRKLSNLFSTDDLLCSQCFKSILKLSKDREELYKQENCVKEKLKRARETKFCLKNGECSTPKRAYHMTQGPLPPTTLDVLHHQHSHGKVW